MYVLMKVICSCKGPKKKRWWGTVFRPIIENRGLNWLLVRCHKPKHETILYAQQYSLFALRTWFIDWSHTYPWCWGPSHIYQSKRDMFCSRSRWRTLHSKLWNVPAQHLFFQVNSGMLVTRATKTRSCYTRCHSVLKIRYLGCFCG